MNWNEEKRICVSIEDKRKRGESRTTARAKKEKERERTEKYDKRSERADHRRRIRLLLVFRDAEWIEKYQTGGVLGPEGGPFTDYGRLD